MIFPIIGSQYPKSVIPLIFKATTSIKIVVFDWRWYPDRIGNSVQVFNQALVCASRRGVDVRAVVNSLTLAERLNSLGIKAKHFKDKRVLHSKLLWIDEKYLVIGSHNFTQSAFASNLETSVILHTPLQSPPFLDFFNNLYNS